MFIKLLFIMNQLEKKENSKTKILKVNSLYHHIHVIPNINLVYTIPDKPTNIVPQMPHTTNHNQTYYNRREYKVKVEPVRKLI